jgi:sugar lactone lactonase YvrE
MLGRRVSFGSLVVLACAACHGSTESAGQSERVSAGDGALALDLLAGGLGGAGTTDGLGAGARLMQPEDVAFDGQGNLYVADGQGVRRVDVTSGRVTTLAGSFDHPVGLAVDGAGNLFVTDSGDSSIQRVVLATGQVSTLVTGTASPDLPHPLTVHGVAAYGGSLYVANPEDSTIRRVDVASGAATTIAGVPGSDGTTDGIGAAAKFHTPRGVASDGRGNLFIADAGSHTVRKLVIATGAVTTVAGSPGLAGSVDGVGGDARFDEPRNIVVDGAGALYVTSAGAVRKIVLATGAVTTVAGSGDDMGTADGSGTSARFDHPRGLAMTNGQLFVADTANDTLRKIALETAAVTTFAGKAAAAGATDGLATEARFSTPMGIAIDGDDQLYVADRANQLIRKVDARTGDVTTLAGGAAPTAPYDGVGRAARFFSPLGVAADRRGHLFVADGSNIRSIELASKTVTTIAYLLRDFDLSVFGIAADDHGGLFVHDRLHVYALPITGGTPVLVAGGESGSVDGVGANARFLRIDSITTDREGNLFVLDGGQYRTVRKIVASTGAVTTLKKLPPDPWDGNPQAEYRGMAVDASGAIFVSGSHDVFELVPSADTVSRYIGTGEQWGVKLGSLPAGLSKPRGLAFTRSGSLVVADAAENALLRVH